jgi:hypothetical protein
VELLGQYKVFVSSHVLDVAGREAIEALLKKFVEQHAKVD